MTLRKGDRSEDVKTLQRALHLVDDGIFGEITEEAVKAFQREHGLKVDGIVGPKTFAALSDQKISDLVLHKTKRKINLIVVHSTATQEGKDYTVEDIRRIHKNKGYSDIGYHYVIYRDGSLHQGRNVNLVGAHAKGHNPHSIGIVYVGGCSSTEKDKKGNYKAKDTRTDAQKATLRKLLTELKQLYPAAKIVGHRNVNATACPSFDAKTEYKDI